MLKIQNLTGENFHERVSASHGELHAWATYAGRRVKIIVSADHIDGQMDVYGVVDGDSGRELALTLSARLFDHLQQKLAEQMDAYSDDFFTCSRCEVVDHYAAMEGDGLCECCYDDTHR